MELQTRMRNKTLSLILAFSLGALVSGPALSMAQSSSAELQEGDIAQARKILQNLRAGKKPTRKEVDVLERVLMQVEQSRNLKPEGRDKVGTVAKPSTPTAATTTHPPPLPSGLSTQGTKDGPVYMYVVDLDKSLLRSFWLDPMGQPYGSIERLLEEPSLKDFRLKFAINGGIYDDQLRPKGLYIEQGKLLKILDTANPGSDQGNFYLEPNGVFVIDSKGSAHILTTEDFAEQFLPKNKNNIQLAVQSGPALLINGVINSQFAEQSNNKKKRSGVGVINDRRVVFALSSKPISFYDFAALFARAGCRNALYLDGDVGGLYVEGGPSVILNPHLVTILAVGEKVRVR